MKSGNRASSKIALGLGVGLSAALLLAIWFNQTESQPDTKPTSSAAELPAPKPSQTSTVGSAWQWRNTAAMTGQTDPTASEAIPEHLPFSADAIYEALQEVQIDENGDVVLDNKALEALNKTFKHGQVELSEEQLAALQELIQVGLPGKAGEQTARIVGDFYQYLEAKEDFNSAHRAPANQVPADATVEQQYAELRALRQTYLGQDVADKLFAQEDAGAQYMFKAREIQADPNLTPEQKVRKAEDLGRELLNQPTDAEQ